jgi:FkbM family methyltransferase
MPVSTKIISAARSFIKKIMILVGLEIIRASNLEKLERASEQLAQQNYSFDIKFIVAMPESKREKIIDCVSQSKAQLRQDIFVLSELDFKTNGFFVEFGATDGMKLSNTYLLEKKFQWTGILAEPARVWRRSLSINRPNSMIENRCLWNKTGEELLFNEVNSAELSTITDFQDSDFHGERRINGKRYKVKTISLNDLLAKWEAPNYIDYLSIDTEGSELEILGALNFERYTFGVITCEHNYSPRRRMIKDLLEKNGYSRRFEELSKFDDWYVRVNKQ